MKSKILLSYVLLLICVFDTVFANLNDFIMNLPHELENAFNSAWTRVSKAIKRPVKIKRLGRGRRKRTTSLTSTSTPPMDMSTFAIYLFSRPLTLRDIVKPTIPVLPSPTFKTLTDWRNLQIPYLVQPIQTDPTTPEGLFAGAPRIKGPTAAKDNVKQHLGLLFFI